MDNIEQALNHLFERHRIVFWYDEKGDLRQEFDEAWLIGVEKHELIGNDFGLKYRILRESQDQKYLIYHAGPQPADLDNWLLDIQLAEGMFNADQNSLWLSEVGLGLEYWELAQEHAEFFRSSSWRAAMRRQLDAHDSVNKIRMKMLVICAGEGIPPRLEDLLENLLEELAAGEASSLEEIQTCGLDGFLWDQLRSNFGYPSDVPGMQDFAIALFQSCYALGLGEKAPLNQEALVFLRRWKDSRRYHRAFETLSEKCAGILNIEADLAKRPLDALLEMDYFKLIDLRIISELVEQVAGRTLPAAGCDKIIRRRRASHWFKEFENLYEAIEYAAQFLAELERADLTVLSIADGVQKYANTWHRLDQLYRKFIFHARASRQVSILESLSELIENLYTNNFLLKVNNNLQPVVDACQFWEAAPVNRQQDFFEHYVRSYVANQKKVAVIISDALRYEIGVELVEKICSENRFEADIEPLTTMLPSFTQLGMAALLPHQELTLTGDGTVLVDGQSSSGIDNRGKIINAAITGSTALRADHFMKMSREDSRALFRDHHVVYIYHNQIDLVGDKRESEERVFDAVEETLKELLDLIKKLTNANYTSILVTSDHGFIYQNRPLEESDYAGIEITGEEIHYRDRRFVLGMGLHATSSVKKFHASQLGLHGEIEVMIPKSIHRLRLKGSGSRYVHGGATLQEVVIPVIQIRKKRESDINLVTVDILRDSSVTISTGQLLVSFFQDQPVSSKLQERRLRAGIYSVSGELISDQHDLIFDLTSEDPRQREVKVRFILSRKADQFNEQEVILKLEQAVPGTSYFQEYKSARYLLRRSFTSDFDF